MTQPTADTQTTDFRLSEWFDLPSSSRRAVAETMGLTNPGDPTHLDNERDKIWLLRAAERGLVADLGRWVRRYA